MFGNGWWVSTVLEAFGPFGLSTWVVWIIGSITLHELAHGWAALKKGDPTPEATGHMTLNPVVHMGVPSLIVFALTGIAWGAMPVDPTRMRGRYAEAFVAVAGPATNFILAAICIFAAGVLAAMEPAAGGPGPIPEHVHGNLTLFFRFGAMLNIALGIFNLLPIPPLDGSRILSNFSRAYAEFTMSQAGGFLSMVGFALAFFFAGSLIFKIGAIVLAAGSLAVELGLRAVGLGA